MLAPVLPFGSVVFFLKDVLFGGLQYFNPSETGDWFSSILIRSDWLPVISTSPSLLADEAKGKFIENVILSVSGQESNLATWFCRMDKISARRDIKTRV